MPIGSRIQTSTMTTDQIAVDGSPIQSGPSMLNMLSTAFIGPLRGLKIQLHSIAEATKEMMMGVK